MRLTLCSPDDVQSRRLQRADRQTWLTSIGLTVSIGLPIGLAGSGHEGMSYGSRSERGATPCGRERHLERSLGLVERGASTPEIVQECTQKLL